MREELYERILDYTGVLNWAALCGSNGPNAPASAAKGVNPSPNARDFIQVRGSDIITDQIMFIYIYIGAANHVHIWAFVDLASHVRSFLNPPLP